MSARTSNGLTPVGGGDHVLGAKKPQLTLVEYGDFGCPHCFAAKLPIESLLQRFDGLRLVWRHFPDPDLHPGADLAAELSELAAAHGKFWQTHSLLLAGRGFSKEGLLKAASSLELGGAEAGSVLSDRTYRPRVEVDIASGEAAGAHGTPTFFVDGQRLIGHWRQLAQIVPAALKDTS
ncbi:MAG: DsbA family protein [Solirubrobacterales bacterium]